MLLFVVVVVSMGSPMQNHSSLRNEVVLYERGEVCVHKGREYTSFFFVVLTKNL